MFSAMGKVTISAYTFFKCTMQVALVEKILYAFMATQTEGINIIFHQVLKTACMYIVTGVAFPLIKRKMDITESQALYQFYMTLIAEIGYPTFKVSLGIAETAAA